MARRASQTETKAGEAPIATETGEAEPARLRIRARRAGFRRGGIAHSARPVVHPRDRFTAAEIAALKSEPMLVVEEL